MTAAASVPTPVHALDNTVSNDFWDTTEYVNAANQIIERVNKVYPDESLEDIVKLYCRSYYGPATGPLMRVYADRVVFTRREFVAGMQLGDDIVMPLPAAEKRPFEFEARAAKARAPEFPQGAKLLLKRSTATTRGGKKSRKGKVDVWALSIPAANAVRTARAVRYDITVSAADEAPRAFSMIVEGARFSARDPRANASETFTVACDRVPAGDATFSVRAVSCWGRTSRPISVSTAKA